MNELKDLGIVLALLCAPILALGAAWPLGKAIAARLAHRDSSDHDLEALEARLTRRLDAIEQAVATVAVEVERIGETHRFLAKEVAARHLAALPKIASRMVTPH